jgi:uncharacterized protein (DUF2141 family)
MKHIRKLLALGACATCLFAFTLKEAATHYQLTVSVAELRNSEGTLLFSLYNREGSIPDKKLNNHFRLLKGEISRGKAEVTFSGLPAGKYAIGVLHDENNNGEIDKGFMLPEEGVGYSNYTTINIKNRPAFSKASFNLKSDTTVVVKINYF